MLPEEIFDTIPEMLHDRVQRTPTSTALSEKEDSQRWVGLSWKRFGQEVEHLTQQLLEAGIDHGDQVAILMPNSVQWEIIQHAVFRIGGIIIGLDLNDPAQRVDDILSKCHTRALFVDSTTRLDQIPHHHLRAIDLIFSSCGEAPSSREIEVQSLSDLKAPSSPLAPRAPDTASIATIIFTSGTTGQPKALRYTHGQLVLAVRSITRLFATLPEQANTACWLPLANPFQRIINLCAIAANWQCFIVPDPTRIMNAVREIEPYFFAGVPRFYEKLFQAIEDEIRQKPSWQRVMSFWAIGVGKSFFELTETNGAIPWHLKWMHRIADALVLRKIRGIMGKHLKYFICGSAPLSSELIKKSLAFGWSIYQAYGISENIAPMAMNSPTTSRLGSVGRPLAENTITIAEDGEILVKGACVATNLNSNCNRGFLSTGDIGRIDPDGYLYLLGRKNDTFKLSTGRKIIPQAIEEALTMLDGVEHCIALGHNRKQVVALLNISERKWRHLSAINGGEECAHAAIKKEVRQACGHLPRYCQPADVLIINDKFSPATGELTTNLKLRRNVVLSKYTSTIDRCYQQIETDLKSDKGAICDTTSSPAPPALSEAPS